MQVALQPILGMNPTCTSSLMPLASILGSDEAAFLMGLCPEPNWQETE